MKSFLATALLGALAFADDAADKQAVVDKDQHGATIGSIKNAIAQPDVTLTTGGTARGVFKQVTGWFEQGSTDAQVFFNFSWTIEPTADYDPGSSKLDIAFAADKTAAEFMYMRFSRLVASTTTLFAYNYNKMARNFDSFETNGFVLASSETTALTQNLFRWTIINGTLSQTGTTVDRNYWDIDTDNSTYEDDGKQTIVLKRTGGGIEDLKKGGAAYVWWQFVDSGGVQRPASGAYYKWADEDHGHSGGALSMTAYATVAAAAIYALF